MTERELLAFIESNEESEILEYKLKTNFNEIKKNIEAIKERMHFNILKTIYAFANTKGGDLYIGVKDKERDIVGIDDFDKNIVEQKMLNRVKMIKTEKTIIKLPRFKRVVIRIKVDKLNLWDKPLFLDGILYIRENTETKKVKFFKDYLSLYENKQFYIVLIEGIRNNLKKLAKQQGDFEVQQFIEGLKMHIKFFTGNKIALKKAEDLLDEIKQKIVNSKDRFQGDLPPAPFSDLDSLVDKFIEVYKIIISEG